MFRLFCALFAETFSWKRVFPSGTPPSKRVSHTCASWKNKIIVIGGEDSFNYYLSDVHILDAGILLEFLFPNLKANVIFRVWILTKLYLTCKYALT